jgi:hypothetical protein
MDSTKGLNTRLTPEDNSYSKTDASFSLSRASLIAIGLTPIICVVVLGLYCLIWGVASLWEATANFRDLKIILPILFISIAAHEGLHWLGYVGFAHLSWKEVRFGFNWRSLSAYAHSDAQIGIASYRRLVGLPGIILGLIPVIVGIACEAGSLTLYGFLMLIGASGDVAILWRIRHVPPNSLVIDHPDRAGCWVLAEGRAADVQSSNAEGQTPVL